MFKGSQNRSSASPSEPAPESPYNTRSTLSNSGQQYTNSNDGSNPALRSDPATIRSPSPSPPTNTHSTAQMTNGSDTRTMTKASPMMGDGMNLDPNDLYGGSYKASAGGSSDYGFIQQQQDIKMSQHRRDDCEYDTIVVGGSRSVGAPTPTSTHVSGGGRRGSGSISGISGGRQMSEVDEGTGGIGLDTNMPEGVVPGHMVSPGYMLDRGMDIDDGRLGEDVASTADGTLTGEVAAGSEETPGPGKMGGDEANQGPILNWSETKTKAGKDRKRLPLACIACRRKKIRCSGEKPACRHCLRSRTPCVYKQSARKTAPRTDYMAMLDRRLRRMEERLIKNVPKDEVNAMLAITGRSVIKPNVTSNGSKSSAAVKKRSAETAFEEEFDPWANSEYPTKQKNGGTRGLDSLGKTAKKGLQSDTDTDDDGSQALPSKDIQEHLAEVFFDYLYGQPYFLLHKPSFMRRLRSGTVPPVLALAICAVSARFSKHPAVHHDPPFLAGEVFASQARRLVLKNFDNPNITNLIVCVVLSLHEFGTCQGGRSWAFAGMATRMAHALRLHKETNHDPLGKTHPLMRPDYIHEDGAPGGYMSFTDREIRRRCMWACFVLDRFTASGTERPPMISESEVEIQLPVSDRCLELDIPTITEQLHGGIGGTSENGEEASRDNMSVGAYMIRIIALYGRVVKYLNQGGKERDPCEVWDPNSHFAKLNAELQHFADDLPERLHFTPEHMQIHATERVFGQFVFVHVAYHQVRLFLHRSALPGTPDKLPPNIPKDFAQSAGEIVLNAATEIAKILAHAQEGGFLVVAPFTGYCAFSASLVHLARMFSPKEEVQIEAKKHMEICLQFLLQLRQYWGLFHSMTNNLKFLYRKFASSMARGSTLVGHEEVSWMFQYGDWFQKYPQGVSASDYKENAVKGQSSEAAASSGEDAALSSRSDLQTAEEFFAKLGPERERRPPVPVSLQQPSHLSLQIPQPTLPPQIQTQGQAQSQQYIQNSPVTHASPAMHRSPASMHHGQSPGIHQSPTICTPPAGIPTPTPIGDPAEMDGKLDPQLLSPQNAQRHTPQQNPYPSNFQSNPATQHASPMNSYFPNIPSPVGYPNCSVSLPQNSGAPLAMHHTHHQANAPYLYDAYPGGSDPSFIASSLSDGLWPGFNPQMNITDASALPDQTSSAWFLPFNLCPPEFDAAGLDGPGFLGGGADGGGGGGVAGGGGDGRSCVSSHMISAIGSGETGLGGSSTHAAFLNHGR